MKKNIFMLFSRCIFLICITTIFTGCGFHLQGEIELAPPLHRLSLKAPDAYGQLARNLQQYLKASKVQLVSSPAEAKTVLVILQDNPSEELISVSGTNQTRQYYLRVTVVFEITDPIGRVLVSPQTLVALRTITIQSNQILGGSNEATLFYQQMRRELAYAIMNRIASKEITRTLMAALSVSS